AASTVCKRTASEREAVLDRLATAQDDYQVAVERSINRWYPSTANVPETVARHTRSMLEQTDYQSFLRPYEVFAYGDGDLAAELPSLHQPLLAITGELDPGSTPDMSRRLVDAVPRGSLHIVAGAHHMLSHENPAEFTEHIAQHFALRGIGNPR